jgi:hypothetical protein
MGVGERTESPRRSVDRRLALAAVTAIAAAAVGLTSVGGAAGAASFTVTNTKDSGAGSLRRAIAKSKAAPGRNTITFAARLRGAITLTTGPLTIDSAVEIKGPGAGALTISGNDADRVVVVPNGVKVKIRKLTISDGRIEGGDVNPVLASGGNGGRGGSGGGAGGNGGSAADTGTPGADALGAGIHNQGQLLLDRVVVTGNRGIAGRARGLVSAEAGSGGGGGEGATGGPGGTGGNAASSGAQAGDVRGVGVANEGSMTLRGTTVANNVGVGGAGATALATAGSGGTGGGAATATGGAGGNAAAAGGRGGDALGAGVYNTGNLTIERTTISANTAAGGDGGNARARAGDGGDGSTGNGGNGGSAAAAGGRGGDARGAGVFNTGALEARNSTVAANAVLPGDAGTSSSRSGSGGSGGGGGGNGGNGGAAAAAEGSGGEATGGGIHNAAGGSANVLSLTISRNAAREGSNIFAAAATEVRNTIIADPRGAGKNCSGPVTSRGHNIEGGQSCGLNRPNDQPKTNPRLGSLRNNGGPTFTQAIPKLSPAVDSGTAAGLTTDQRGKPRRVDIPGRPNRFGSRGADVGAFELQRR